MFIGLTQPNFREFGGPSRYAWSGTHQLRQKFLSRWKKKKLSNSIKGLQHLHRHISTQMFTPIAPNDIGVHVFVFNHTYKVIFKLCPLGCLEFHRTSQFNFSISFTIFGTINLFNCLFYRYTDTTRTIELWSDKIRSTTDCKNYTINASVFQFVNVVRDRHKKFNYKLAMTFFNLIFQYEMIRFYFCDAINQRMRRKRSETGQVLLLNVERVCVVYVEFNFDWKIKNVFYKPEFQFTKMKYGKKCRYIFFFFLNVYQIFLMAQKTYRFQVA